MRAFETLVQQHPQSPRARYGKAQVLYSTTAQYCSPVNWYCTDTLNVVTTICWQAEDDLAEKLRSNDMLQRAINSYRDAAELPDVTSDLLRAALKRQAERQQFLGNTNTHTTASTTTTRNTAANPPLSDMHLVS